MMIWLHGGAAATVSAKDAMNASGALAALGGGLGVEDGILRAAEVDGAAELDALRRAMDAQRDEILAQAREQAQSVLTEAHEEAARLLEAARAEADRLRHDACEAGRRQAALEWHERQTVQAIDNAQVLRGMHEKLAMIVTGAVERIVHTEERAALYQRALRSVRSFARGASTLALRVSADDHAHARAALDSLKALQTQGLHIEVSVDPALRAGSCVFESEVGILDASLQTQLDGLRAAMDRAVRKALASSQSLLGDDDEQPAQDDGDEPRRHGALAVDRDAGADAAADMAIDAIDAAEAAAEAEASADAALMNH